MDRQTQRYYSSNAKTLACRYAMAGQGVIDRYAAVLGSRSKVLDIGCGTGHDFLELLKRGHDAYGADACQAMIDEAKKTVAAAGYSAQGRLFVSALPDLDAFETGEFDAVLCSSVLMHIPEESIFDAVYGLRRVLRTGGTLLLSIPDSRPDVDAVTRRDDEGRLFTELPACKVRLLFERVGFRLEKDEIVPDSLGRPGITWQTFQFARLDEQADRPLNLVESILNRDKKDATYKLALFRALAEIAQTQHHIAIFTTDNQVKIPVAAIAEKWLLYYWPIFASDRFICQKNGESPDSLKPVAIRKPMMALINHYTASGGLAAFHSAWKGKSLAPNVAATLKDVMSKLKETVWTMPVRFAGGGDEFSVFDYDRADKLVSMRADLWRELCLTGSWIQDATILRWAELTERLSKGEVKASTVIDCLLTTPDPKRKVHDAKIYFESLRERRCVWSDKPLMNREFEIDHAIPFSLWRNNDLWNLFAAAPAVNRGKSDRLPRYEVLLASRDRIVETWRGLNEALGSRFAGEAQTLMGREMFEPSNWEGALFSRFVEAFEITATQRGIERWQPDGFVAVPKSITDRPQPGPVYYAIGEERIRPSGICGEASGPKIVAFSEVKQDAFVCYLPIVGSVAAGLPFHGIDTGDLTNVSDLDWIEVPPRMAGKTRFVVRVAGNSMEPDLHVGDHVVFEYHRSPRSEGQIVIANIPEFGLTDFGVETIKRIRGKSDSWIFESANSAYSPIVVPKSDVSHPILGMMIGKL